MMGKLKYIKLILSMMLLLLASDIYGQSCSSYTTWRSGMWIGPGSYCGSLYGGTTVTYNGRLYTHRGYCSSQGPGSWDFRDIGACTSCSTPGTPGTSTAINQTCSGFTARWGTSSNSPTGYYLYVSTASNFSSYVSGFNGKNVGNTTSSAVTGLNPGVKYYYRVKAYKTGCPTSGYSGTMNTTTSAAPGTPGTSTAINPTCSGFTARWGASSNSPTGYYLYVSTASNFSSHISGFNGKNVGNVTQYNITGLSPGVTYYYRVRAHKSGCSTSGYSGTMNKQVYSNANNPGAISVPSSVCVGTTTTISNITAATTGSPASSGPTYYFYYRGGPSNVGWTLFSTTTNSSATLPSTVTNTAGQWYVARNSAFSCTGQANNSTTLDKPITVTASPTVGTVTGGSRCGTGTLQIKADVSAGTVRWWTAASGGSQVGTSGDNALWTTPSISSTTTYYAEAINGSCVSSSRKAVTATVTAPPTAGTLSGTQAICVSGSTTFSSTSSGGTWSSSNTGIATINSSTGVISGVSAGTATMTYTKTGSGGCSNATATRTVTVSAIPAITGTTPNSRCGTGTVALGAAASAGTINWYAASTGGASLGTGTSFTTPSISSTTTYYVDATSGGCTTASRTAVTATVNVNPTVTVSTQSKCGNVGDMIFTFPDESSRTNIEFSINNGSTYVYNTADNVGSYTASSLAPGNYEVWTRWGNDECPVDLGTITITGNVTPSITSSSSGSRCNSGTVDINATSSAGSIDWYTSSTGGSSIGSSNSSVNWTTPSISSTTTYYAEGVNGSCISSSRTAVTATVNTVSVGPGGVTDELMVWLKADDANLGSTWQDNSCNGYDYTKVTGPTLVNNGWNHNPSIEILSGGFDAPAGAELGTEWTVFFVSALKSSDKHGRLIEGHTGNYLLGYHGGYRNSIYWGGTAAEHNSGIAIQIDVESPHIFMYKRENTGGNIITKIDGDYKKTFTSTNSGSGIRLDINQGSYKNSESTHSRIGEFIIYNKTLSDVEVRKVEAYLATKYGIVLSYDDGGTGGDYISTGGTTYWDASARSGYTNDVVVIGKDNSTALTQKQAKSKDDSLQVFISSLASNNASNNGSISNNESFIAIGHNGGKLKTSESANTEKPAGVFSRFEREWCLTNTNFTDDFSLKVEWDSAGTFDINDIRLLVDDDGDFSNASVYGPADGLTFSIGSIVVGGASSSMFPSGDTKYFTLASSSESTPLPIELLYFTANEEEGYIILNWETAMEINNDYFIVEKSTDGNNWEQITTVPGAGISTSSITYVYVDRDICENTCYYRLTQVDYDGTSKTFKTIHVNADIYNDVINMEVVPNPVSSKANVSVNAYEDGISYFKVLNIQGDLIYTATVPIYKGVNYFDINMSIYESGTYYFNIQMESGQTKTVPVVKK